MCKCNVCGEDLVEIDDLSISSVENGQTNALVESLSQIYKVDDSRLVFIYATTYTTLLTSHHHFALQLMNYLIGHENLCDETAAHLTVLCRQIMYHRGFTCTIY